MAARHGNGTKRQAEYDRFKAMWEWKRPGAREKPNKSNGEDFADLLDLVVRFRKAARELRNRGFANEGLWQNMLRQFRARNDGVPAWRAMPYLHRLVRAGKWKRAAAEQTAGQLGIPGASFEAVVEELRKKIYPAWLITGGGGVAGIENPHEIFPEWLDPRSYSAWLETYPEALREAEPTAVIPMPHVRAEVGVKHGKK